MKKTMIALVALSGLAMAETVTFDLFSTTEGWTLSSLRGRQVVSIDTTEKTLYNNACNWGQDVATTTLGGGPLGIVKEGDQLDLSFTLTTTGSYDACVTLTLVDTTKDLALTIGMGGYNGSAGAIQYGTGAVKAQTSQNDLYSFQTYVPDGETEPVYRVTPLGTITTIGQTGSVDIAASLSMNTEGQVIATLGTATLNLGESFMVDKLVVNYDCASSETNHPVMSNLVVKHTPEPATATLSLLALAGLAARRRRH